MGFWTVPSLLDDYRLSHLSDELIELRVDMVGLSETRRSSIGKTSINGFTYHWSSMNNGHHVKGVTIGISSRLQPSVMEVTPYDEYIM